MSERFEKLEREWSDALIRQERSALDEILAPDYTLTISSNPDRPMSRDAWLASAVSAYRVESMKFAGFRAAQVTSDVVVVSMHCDQKAFVGGVDRSTNFFITDLWRNDGERWRVVARFSSYPEAESASTRAVLTD